MKNQKQRGPKPTWLAWAISLGHAVLLLAFGILLSQYWLMLPVWMRSTVGSFYALAWAILIFRLFRFHRARKASVPSQTTSQDSKVPQESLP